MGEEGERITRGWVTGEEVLKTEKRPQEIGCRSG